MIKKILLASVVAIGGMFSANAQSTELTVSYGGYTQMDGSDMHDGWDHVNNAWGALNAGVNFRVNSKIWLGPSYTFSSTTTKGQHHSNIAYHAIMLNGRYHYYRNSIITLYAKLGLGVEISHMMPRGGDSYNKAYCAFQIVPVGATFDINRNIAMFGELGYGAQGLVQVGFRFKL